MTKEIPVTLLSGFLGSGKTTLLKHILENKSNLKCAVIVNDMAAINIDAALIKSSSSKFIQKEEQLVQLQNGCICCTLRGDLVQEIGRLARENGAELDYIVIESTGISEPMQVAETFALTQEELDGEKDGPVFAASPELQSLVGIARLDTCVSVVDTYNLLDYFEEAKFIGQKFQGVDKADERTVTDLLMDQLEFANVIILNKVETVKGSDKLQKCIELVKNLNPSAKIIQSSFCKVDLKDILNTKSFNMLEAQTSAGWLQSLKEEHVPETIEYGISSFVYRGRRPFHPERLYNLLKKSFFIIEPYFEEGGEEMGDGEQDGEDDEQDDEDEQEEQEIDQKEAEKRKRNKQKSVFCNVLRSKGFMWLATRYSYMSEWSQVKICIYSINKFQLGWNDFDG